MTWNKLGWRKYAKCFGLTPLIFVREITNAGPIKRSEPRLNKQNFVSQEFVANGRAEQASDSLRGVGWRS